MTILTNPELLQLYLDKKQKAAFKRLCRVQDVTMSQAIRRYIKHCIDQGKVIVTSDTIMRD